MSNSLSFPPIEHKLAEFEAITPEEGYPEVALEDLRMGDIFSRTDMDYKNHLYIMLKPELRNIGQCTRIGQRAYETYFIEPHGYTRFNKAVFGAVMPAKPESSNERKLTLGEL